MACFVRVVYIFGGRVKDPVNDLTPTFLTDRVLATLRCADDVVNKILHESGNNDNKNIRTVAVNTIYIAPLSYIFYGVSLAGVSCRRRRPLPTTPALTTLLGY